MTSVECNLFRSSSIGLYNANETHWKFIATLANLVSKLSVVTRRDFHPNTQTEYLRKLNKDIITLWSVMFLLYPLWLLGYSNHAHPSCCRQKVLVWVPDVGSSRSLSAQTYTYGPWLAHRTVVCRRCNPRQQVALYDCAFFLFYL